MYDAETDGYVEHALVTSETVEAREYQVYLANASLTQSTLVVLPTGTGKTAVSMLVSAERLLEQNGGTCLMLAPTKPLVEQHAQNYREKLDIAESQICVLTGETPPEERGQIWDEGRSVVIATPQVIENDVLADRISLRDVIHLTIDECHNATGNYPYVYLANKYASVSESPLVTGLSASPGDTKSDVLQICENIGVAGIEVMTEDDPRLAPYVYETEIDERFIDIDEDILSIRDSLQDVYKQRLKNLKQADYIDTAAKSTSIGKLQRSRGRIQSAMNSGESEAYQAMSFWAEAMKLGRAIELIETQGVEALCQYISRLEADFNDEDASKALKRMLTDHTVQRAVENARSYEQRHDKLDALRAELVQSVKLNAGQVLVFTQSRDTVETITELLSEDFSVARLVGQTDKTNSDGMSQDEQIQTLDEFGNGQYDVLVSTQVGEEGLDIPSVDLVLFYEPVPKGISAIQRRGRTGRTQQGRVVILIGRKTRDMGYYYKAKNQEEQLDEDMDDLEQINDLRQSINDELSDADRQTTLGDDFDTSSPEPELPDSADTAATDDTEETPDIDESSETPTIVVDHRETNSAVPRELSMADDIEIDIAENLEVGDYIVSNNCAVERKSVEDFHSTITGDRSLFEQIAAMATSYDTAVLLIEGEQERLYGGNIHENAIRGALASAVSDFGVTIMYSTDQNGTAQTLRMLAQKEQDQSETTVNPHGRKRTQTLADQQEYIVSSIDTVGPETARSLLTELDTVKNVFTASHDQLTEIDGIGGKTAETISSVSTTEFVQDELTRS